MTDHDHTHHDGRNHTIAVPATQAAYGAEAGLIFGLYVGSAATSTGDDPDASKALADTADAILRSNLWSAYTAGGNALSMLVGIYLGRWCDLVVDYIPVCESPDHQHGDTTIGRLSVDPDTGRATVTLRTRQTIRDGWKGTEEPSAELVGRVAWFGELLKAKADHDHDTYGRMMNERLGPLLAPARDTDSLEVHTTTAAGLVVFLHSVVTAAAMTFAELQTDAPTEGDDH